MCRGRIGLQTTSLDPVGLLLSVLSFVFLLFLLLLLLLLLLSRYYTPVNFFLNSIHLQLSPPALPITCPPTTTTTTTFADNNASNITVIVTVPKLTIAPPVTI
ncbi:hypothetical protein E2C01_099513 [Portunus trituberculatus]|uniref:Uncharacterized protein n=1 Tax=Portunus trituberculatus TaxID=210409 RepID=A0A5B7KF68_PORTR|nr:hypothetical protein [Portunus trituberculatus]